MDILVLKLWCKKCSASTERPTPPLVEEEAPFVEHIHVWERKNILFKSLKET
jgi:hypothetical protein